MQARLRRRVRAGFTLIELVVVLLILATLAGLIVPLVGMLGRSSDMAASAKTQADLANNTQLFFVLQKRYPQGLDSLLVTGGTAVYAADTTDPNTQTIGLPYAGADGTRLQAQLTPLTVTPITGTASIANPDWFRCITRSGFDWIYHHDVAALNSNNSGIGGFTPLITNANGSGNPAVTTFAVAEVTGTYMLGKLVPQGLKPGEKVIAFGVGPQNTAIGKTLQNAPIYPGCDGKYYGHFVIYFKIYASGERATLIGASDSYGRTPNYTQQQFNESLPDGGRQG